MITRRNFLKKLGSGAVTLVGVRILSGCESIEFDSKIDGSARSFLTSAEDGSWYWQNGNPDLSKATAPDISTDDWQLEVRDDSDTLSTLTYDDLKAYAGTDELTYWKTMRCVFGAKLGTRFTTFVANGVFRGIPLPRVLEDAGASADAAKLRTFGADGFQSNLPMERAMQPGPTPLPALLAYELNSAPISRLRGGPVRLVIPEMWGYKNVKWIEKLQATDSADIFGTYETERFNPETTSYSAEVQKRIDDPGRIALTTTVSDPADTTTEIAGPEVTIAGASFAGGQRIDAVEVSLDGDKLAQSMPFDKADITGHDEMLDALDADQRDLAEQCAQEGNDWPYVGVWITWKKTFNNLDPGQYTATIRTRDDSGRQQSDDVSQPLVVAPELVVPFRVT